MLGFFRGRIHPVLIAFIEVLLLLGRTHALISSSTHRRHRSRFAISKAWATQKHSVTSSSTEATFVAPKFAPDEAGDYPSLLHSIHVKSILSDTETKRCLQLATSYAAETARWEQPDSDRHATYATCDFPVDECETLESYLQEIGFDDRIFSELNQLYGVSHQDMSYLDFFCAHYHAKPNDEQTAVATTMDRLEAHRDGSLLSFTIVLTPPTDFQGGGTFFDTLRDVECEDDPVLQPGGVIRVLRAGDAVLHGGKLLHGADMITSGNRTVLVGFIDVAEWCYRPGILSATCRDWGRMDVAAARWERQQTKTSEGQSGWKLDNHKWYPPTKGRSHIQDVRPAFMSVKRRAELEYQRRRKLESEDTLLRTILLPEDEREELMEGDFTVL